MTNRELFDKANANNDKELQAKLRDDFAEWCRQNEKEPLEPQTVEEWWSQNVEEQTNPTKTCKDCVHFEVCELKRNHYYLGKPIGEVNDAEFACRHFKNKLRFVALPCKIGDTVYKICPKCNDDHNGSCKGCAWNGCLSYYCDVGVGVWSDGSYHEGELQIVPYKVGETRLVGILRHWNIMFFATPDEAEKAMGEYDEIRRTEDRHERYAKYLSWVENREVRFPFLEGDA